MSVIRAAAEVTSRGDEAEVTSVLLWGYWLTGLLVDRT